MNSNSTIEALKDVRYRSHCDPLFPGALSCLHESLGIHEFVKCDGIPYLYECKCSAFATLYVLDDHSIVSKHHSIRLADFSKITSDVARWYAREQDLVSKKWPCYGSKQTRKIIRALPDILHMTGDSVQAEWI